MILRCNKEINFTFWPERHSSIVTTPNINWIQTAIGPMSHTKKFLGNGFKIPVLQFPWMLLTFQWPVLPWCTWSWWHHDAAPCHTLHMVSSVTDHCQWPSGTGDETLMTGWDGLEGCQAFLATLGYKQSYPDHCQLIDPRHVTIAAHNNFFKASSPQEYLESRRKVWRKSVSL